MNKPSPDIETLAKSLQRAKEIFVTPGRGIDSAAKAYGYLELSVERFLQGRERKRKGARKT